MDVFPLNCTASTAGYISGKLGEMCRQRKTPLRHCSISYQEKERPIARSSSSSLRRPALDLFRKLRLVAMAVATWLATRASG